MMYDLVRLSFETTTVARMTLMLNSVGTPVMTIPGETITDSYHNLSQPRAYGGKTSWAFAA